MTAAFTMGDVTIIIKKKRFAFCQKYQDRTFGIGKKAILSDEVTVRLFVEGSNSLEYHITV